MEKIMLFNDMSKWYTYSVGRYLTVKHNPKYVYWNLLVCRYINKIQNEKIKKTYPTTR